MVMRLGSPIPDFAGVSDFRKIHERFIDAAQSIMADHEIVRGASRWRITAVELYLFTETSSVWRDPNTHRNPDQACSGTWYVHQRPMNRSGLDITAGNIRHGLYVGFLIREIDLIDGPAKALKALIRDKSNGSDDASKDRYKWSEQQRALIGNIRGQSIWGAPLKLSRSTERMRGDVRVGPRLNLKYKSSPWDSPLRAWIGGR
jgi:hypothetical protein